MPFLRCHVASWMLPGCCPGVARVLPGCCLTRHFGKIIKCAASAMYDDCAHDNCGLPQCYRPSTEKV
ncbi:hypothetical protein NY78_2178 [Desulfovibrio sp. TomC]|nr:hypothetical protein NY78_2178 [Desulfovibrio sp. TomC]